MASNYTLTIKIVPIGTPLSDGKTSLTGHMWYEVSGPNTDYGSFGWQKGKGSTNRDNFTTEDSGRYIPDNNHRITSISLGITEEQAKILTEDYPQRVQSGTAEGFNADYNVLTNSCVDHVALGLRSIGLADKDFEGTILFPSDPNNIHSFLTQIIKHLPEGTPIHVENLPILKTEIIDIDGVNFAPHLTWEYYTGIYPKPELDIDLCPTLDKAEQASCPIVIDMNGDGIHYTKLAAGIKEAIHFDLDGNGFAEKTAWLNASDAFLVLDKNHNGKVDNIHEMFGNNTADKNGNKPYQHGYEALAAYDENKDGKIDARDSVYAELAVWQDKNQDGISDEGEIISLAEAGISSIDLAAAAVNVRDEHGNRISHRGSVTFADGSQRTAEDVWFQVNTAQTRYQGELKLSAEQQAELLGLPNIKAFGNVLDLHLAMSQDSELKAMVQAYLAADSSAQKELLNDLIYRWTGSAAVASNSRGGNIDARQLVALEALTGKEFKQNGSRPNPNHNAAPHLLKEYADFAAYTHAWLALHSKAQQGTALHFWQVMSEKSLDLNSELNWQAFAEHLKQLHQQGNNTEAQESYRVMNDLFTYSSAYKLNLRDYLIEHINEYSELFEAEIVIADISGDEQNNQLNGTEASNIIYGKAGNDVLDGKDGNDLYIFAKGDGHDVIFDHGIQSHADRIIFSDIKYEETVFHLSANDLIIRINENDSIRIQNFFHSDSFKIEYFQFADKTRSLEEMLESGLILYGTENSDHFNAWKGKLTFFAGDGNDTIYGGNQDDELHGGKGNDRLQGGNGNDTYVFAQGDGKDSIYDAQGNHDRIIFTDIAYEDIIFKLEGQHLILASGDSDQVKLEYFTYGNSYRIEHFQFADKTFTLEEFLNQSIVLQGAESGNTFSGWQGSLTFYGSTAYDNINGGDSNDHLYGRDGSDSLSGKAGDDRLFGENGHDNLQGGDGNDVLDGGEGNDRLEGGNGNDQLIGDIGDDHLRGGNGDDVYIFSKGHGKDSIYDTQGNHDRIIFTDMWGRDYICI